MLRDHQENTCALGQIFYTLDRSEIAYLEQVVSFLYIDSLPWILQKDIWTLVPLSQTPLILEWLG